MKTLSLLAVLLGVGLVAATPPCHVQPVVQPIQYQVPVLPLYTIGYQPAVDLTPLLEELRALRGEVQQLRSGGGVLPLREEPAGLKVLRQACARCHTEGAAKGKLALFSAAGVLLEDAALKGRIVSAIHEGRMPPKEAPVQLSGEDKYQVLFHLSTSPAPTPAAK